MDALHDHSHRTWFVIGKTILGDGGIPAYVTDYTLPEEKTASAMSDDDFADPGKRLFPLDTAPATWLSAAYFTYHRPMLEQGYGVKYAAWLDSRIQNAVNAWGIQLDASKAIKAIETWQGDTKSAADDDANYGWIVRDDKGAVIDRLFPLFDDVGVRKAAAYFDENRRNYTAEMRKGIATRILEKGAEYGVPSTDLAVSVTREAGDGIPRKLVLMQEINERARLAKDAEAGVLLANINRLVATASDTEFAESIDKIADVLTRFDNVEGLTQHYGRGITYPSDFLCGVTMKEAAAFRDHSVQLRRYVFDTTKLATAVPADVFADVLGKDFLFKVATKVDKAQAGSDGYLTYEGVTIDPTLLKQALAELPAEDKAAFEDIVVALCD